MEEFNGILLEQTFHHRSFQGTERPSISVLYSIVPKMSLLLVVKHQFVGMENSKIKYAAFGAVEIFHEYTQTSVSRFLSLKTKLTGDFDLDYLREQRSTSPKRPIVVED